jgi:hypothetical protein
MSFNGTETWYWHGGNIIELEPLYGVDARF